MTDPALVRSAIGRDLSPVQSAIIAHLYHRDGWATIEELAVASGLHTDTARGHANRLEQFDIVQRATRTTPGAGPSRLIHQLTQQRRQELAIANLGAAAAEPTFEALRQYIPEFVDEASFNDAVTVAVSVEELRELLGWYGPQPLHVLSALGRYNEVVRCE